MVMFPQIILLNGTSSSGKTTLAKALQSSMPITYFHVCIDAFEEMMPSVKLSEPKGEPIGAALRVMSSCIATLAAEGHRIIVDHVLIEGEEPLDWVPNYLAAVAPYLSLNVKVFAPIEVLRAREAKRGDRRLGLAKWQSSRMHRLIDYDVEVNTAEHSPQHCASAIRNFIESWDGQTVRNLTSN